MLASLIQNAAPISTPKKPAHILVVLPRVDALGKGSSDKSSVKRQDKPDFFGKGVLEILLSRRKMQLGEMAGSPLAANLENGSLCAWVMVDLSQSPFEQQTVIRKAVQLLLEENPPEIHLAIYGSDSQRQALAQLAVYACWINGPVLPSRKTGKNNTRRQALARIVLHGYEDADNFVLFHAKAEGNLLTRELTVLPPNELTPAFYRQYVKKLAA